ncbi:regulator [Streptomyces sp. NBC_00433]
MKGHIPRETTSFVGREQELARLGGMMATARLVTVTGAGGVGKTRLAVRAAGHVAGLFPDGVWWADLATLTGPELLLATVSDAVDLADHSPRMPLQVLTEFVADKRLLLVLDSCEHLVEDCAHLVGDLLTAAAGVTVLATSRRPLFADGRDLLVLDPLPVDGPEAQALFADRVAERAGGHAMAEPGADEAAAALCRRLEGIPLAIELAAGQVGPASVAEVAEHLGSRFDALTRSDFVWPHRHRAMRTAVGWSHELCAPLERLLWARLSVFRGAFSAESAAEVTGGGPLRPEDVPRLLDGLVSQSVLRRDGERYRMLDTIREYGDDWLGELGERDDLADRHADHFVKLAREAEADWPGTRQIRAYRAVERVHADLRAALDRLLATDPVRAADTAGRLVFFWTCSGHVQEARSYLERALAACPGPGGERTRALTALGIAVTLQGDYPLATRFGDEAMAAARADGDKDAQLAAAYMAGLLDLLAGRPGRAVDAVDAALAASPGFAFDSGALLRCHLVRVFGMTALGDLDRASRTAYELREHCVLIDEVWTRSYLDYQLALIALGRSASGDAVRHARMMLNAKRALGDSFGLALGLDVLAAALAADGRPEAAAIAYGTSETLWRGVGHPQRGTPELKAVRDGCEAALRSALGDDGYDRAYRRGAATASPGAIAALASD